MEYTLEELINDISSFEVIADVITETVIEGDGHMTNEFSSTFVDSPIYLTDGRVNILLEGEFAKYIEGILVERKINSY